MILTPFLGVLTTIACSKPHFIMEGGAEGDIPFFCPFCNFLSQRYTVLKNHILTHNHQTDADEMKLYDDINVKKESIKISFPEFNCDLCSKNIKVNGQGWRS